MNQVLAALLVAAARDAFIRYAYRPQDVPQRTALVTWFDSDDAETMRHVALFGEVT